MLRFFRYKPIKKHSMPKMYSQSRTNRVSKNLVPKDETIRFILNYSKALSVISYKNVKFEALLN